MWTLYKIVHVEDLTEPKNIIFQEYLYNIFSVQLKKSIKNNARNSKRNHKQKNNVKIPLKVFDLKGYLVSLEF